MSQTPPDERGSMLEGFDAAWYLATYADVGPSGLSPERHYTLSGFHLGRAKNAGESAKTGKPQASRLPQDVAKSFGCGDDPLTPLQAVLPQSAIIRAPAGLTKRAPRRVYIAPRKLVAGLSALAVGAVELGFDTDTDALVRAGAQVQSLLALLRTPDTAAPELVVRRMGTADEVVKKPEDLPDMSRMVSPLFLQGPHKITDAWFATTATLRIAVQGNDILEGEADALGIIRAWQPDPRNRDALIALDEVALPEVGPGFIEIALDNPLMPLLLELADGNGTTRGFALLPYPSLLRGGLHHAESVANQLSLMPMADIWRLSLALLREHTAGAAQGGFSVARLVMRLAGATGAEAVFSPQVREWLSSLFGLGLHAADTAEEDDQGTAWLRGSLGNDASGRGDGLTLTLPARAIPSLQALVSRRLHLPEGHMDAPGPWLVSDAVHAKPLWSVAMPASAAASPDMPLLSRSGRQASITEADDTNTQGPSHWMAPLHLAVVLHTIDIPNDTVQFFPIAPDANIAPPQAPADICIVLTVSNPAEAEASLIALQTQTGLHQMDIILRGRTRSTTDNLERIVAKANQLFGRRLPVMPPHADTLEDLDALLAATPAQHIVVMDAAVILHDVHIIAALGAELVAGPRIASVSCSLFHSHLGKGNKPALSFASGGLFPAHISLLSAPRLTVTEPDTRNALPASSYPVLANAFELCMIRRTALEETAAARAAMPGAGAVDMHFGLSALAAGWQNICTSRISAGTTRAPLRRDEIDPFGMACILPARWDELLSQITVLRELRS